MRTFILQIAERFFAHLAGADHQHLLVVEALEDLGGEVAHRDAGNAHAALVQRGFGGHALGHAHGGLKNAVRQRAGTVAALGHFVGLFDLGEDLRLAHDHAVEAGGDHEQVPHGILAGALEQVVEDLVDRQAVKVGHELRDLFVAGRASGSSAAV